jgi:hypothetical protein
MYDGRVICEGWSGTQWVTVYDTSGAIFGSDACAFLGL